MTLIIAALCPRDGAVVAADGLMVAVDGCGAKTRQVNSRAVKTVRLNDGVCLGFSGDVAAADGVFAEATGLPSCGTPAKNRSACEEWESGGREVRATLNDLVPRVSSAIRRRLTAVDLTAPSGRLSPIGSDLVPGVLIAGYRGRNVVIGRWGYPQWTYAEISPGNAATIGIRVDRTDHAGRAMLGRDEPVAQRLVRFIRHMASLDPDAVGPVVSIRRSSRRFALEWYEPGRDLQA
jgi:hypothetical protein